MTALGATGKKIYDAFRGFATAIQDVIMKQLPDLLTKSKKLPEDAEGVKDAAKDEFNGLDMMKKAKAVMAVAMNMKIIAKVPVFVQNVMLKIKNDFQEL